MKKVFPFLACVLFLGISCTEQSTELTDEQKAAIISEVEDQYDGLVSTLNSLNIDSWYDYWSEDEFISFSAGILYFGTQSAWVDSVTIWNSQRESQQVDIAETHVNILTPELAIMTSMTNWDTFWKTGEHRINEVLTSLLWKKESSGWKIIHGQEHFELISEE